MPPNGKPYLEASRMLLELGDVMLAPELRLVGLGRQQGIQRRRIGKLHLDHPTLAKRIVVDQLR